MNSGDPMISVSFFNSKIYKQSANKMAKDDDKRSSVDTMILLDKCVGSELISVVALICLYGNKKTVACMNTQISDNMPDDDNCIALAAVVSWAIDDHKKWWM